MQRAPASTVGDLAQAVIEIFGRNNPIRIIGTRHGEKLYESLLSREEMARADSWERYYRVPADNRDLNYAMYESSGEEKISTFEDYTSHNTERLTVPEIKALLLTNPFVQRELHRD